MKSAFICLALGLCASCTNLGRGSASDTMVKVEIDVDQLDADGLRGPPGGKVAIAYEFAIPDTERCRSEVRSIDPSVKFMPGSRGRVQAGEEECLCIGSTHQEGYREILRALSEAPYITRIIECTFE